MRNRAGKGSGHEAVYAGTVSAWASVSPDTVGLWPWVSHFPSWPSFPPLKSGGLHQMENF